MNALILCTLLKKADSLYLYYVNKSLSEIV